jgi:spore germination protein GerM
MKHKHLGLLALIILCVLAGGFMAYGYNALFSAREKAENPSPEKELPPKTAKLRSHLYFVDENHQFLRAEKRILLQRDSVVEEAKSLINALIRGPKSGLVPTLPEEARLLALYVTEDAVAYVDFDTAVHEKHPGGVLTELFSIFSVVNTLALNLEEVDQVKILINGNEAKTLAGHIDIRFPFRPNVLMIK